MSGRSASTLRVISSIRVGPARLEGVEDRECQQQIAKDDL